MSILQIMNVDICFGAVGREIDEAIPQISQSELEQEW